MFSIETLQEYPEAHDPLLEFAYEEKADNARPELATHIDDLDNYDVIFMGSLNCSKDLDVYCVYGVQKGIGKGTECTKDSRNCVYC